MVLNMNKEIQDISENTNVLSINSSIEAANAGAYGKGFKVLAGEVRNLAMKATESAKKVDEAITQISNRIQIGTQTSETVADTFNNILEKINNFDQYMNKISTITEEQYLSTKSINDLVKQTLNKMEEIVKSIVVENEKLKDILNHSNEIEKLSRKTFYSINDQIDDGNKIMNLIKDMNNIIEDNRNISIEMNKVVDTINDDKQNRYLK